MYFLKYLYLLMREDSSYIILSLALFGVLPALLLPSVLKIKNSMKRNLLIVVVLILSVGSLDLLNPESKYKAILTNKEDTEYTLQHCKISAFNAQPERQYTRAKDAWSCPDGITRYLSVEYRDNHKIRP